MKVGIVGSEAAKFTPTTETLAKLEIHNLLEKLQATEVISGKCHLGGIDIWAVEIAKELGIPTTEYPPKRLTWEYYKTRNIQIAMASDVVICITVKKLPEDYQGMRFEYCYHCHTSDHVKSGGCWTMKYAIKHGKQGNLIVIE